MFKKISVCLIAVLMMSVSCFAVAEKSSEVDFVVKPSSVNNEYKFKINITVENLQNSNIGGIHLSLFYDDAIFKVENVSSKLSGAVVNLKEQNSKVNFAWENSNEQLKNKNVLFTVDFSCKTKPMNSEYSMSLICHEIYEATEDLEKVPYSIKVQPVNFKAITVDTCNTYFTPAKIIFFAVVFLAVVGIITAVYILVLNKKSKKSVGRKFRQKTGRTEND